MYSGTTKQEIDQNFHAFLLRFPEKSAKIRKNLIACNETEATTIKYLYTTMPDSDVINYPFETYMDYVRHGIYLWENEPGVKEIPQFIFMNYILHYRVNEEEISPCRSYFYQQLKDKITSGSLTERILDINYWCAGEVTYQSTDDRCAGAMAVYRSGIGRCGEESTFAVHVLRSMGIPARQVYVPRWSHCDDNHAWVEVYTEGEWHYLGACEPEEVLDNGWFTAAASRAVLVHSRLFLPPDWKRKIKDEEVIGKDGCITMLNQTARYAKTEYLEIFVSEENGSCVSGAEIEIQVFNYASFVSIAKIVTDSSGKAVIRLGKGSIRILLKYGMHVIEKDIIITKENQFKLVLDSQNVRFTMSEKDIDLIAPDVHMIEKSPLHEDKRQRWKKRMSVASNHKSRKEKSFYTERELYRLLSLFPVEVEREQINKLVKDTRGNYKDLEAFLTGAKNPSEQVIRLRILNSLTQKDLRDFNADTLEKHMRHSMPYRSLYPDDIFFSYLMNPRVQWEPMSAYRHELEDQIGKEQLATFQAGPARIMAFIHTAVKENTEFEGPSLITMPAGVLIEGKANTLSKDILFVAICRTAGIPARLHPVDEQPEYYQNGAFHRLMESGHNFERLTLRLEEGIQWIYGENWSLSVYHKRKCRWEFLQLPQLFGKQKNDITLELPLGIYRIYTANRLPNGTIRLLQKEFLLNKCMEFQVRIRSVEAKDMIVYHSLPEFQLLNECGNLFFSKEILNHRVLFIWLDDGKEPTEHILNELCGHADSFNSLELNILFILPEIKHVKTATLKKALSVLSYASIWYDADEKNAETLARRMFVAPDKLPLILLGDENHNGIFAESGYNVGTGTMLLKVNAIIS